MLAISKIGGRLDTMKQSSNVSLGVLVVTLIALIVLCVVMMVQIDTLQTQLSESMELTDRAIVAGFRALEGWESCLPNDIEPSAENNPTF